MTEQRRTACFWITAVPLSLLSGWLHWQAGFSAIMGTVWIFVLIAAAFKAGE